MSKSTPLLGADGGASMATMAMMAHHGLRRDLARFQSALQKVAAGDRSKVEELRTEWRNYRETLHGHHEAEDTRMFPFLRGAHPSLAQVIDGLGADHRRIDPLLERGDRAFAELPATGAAKSVVTELEALLDPHLETEEENLVPHLREAKAFPPPATDEEASLYAQGFAWSSHGIAPEVLERVYAMLPDNLRSRMPAARAAFEEHCISVWGTAEAGASRTSVPER